VARLAESWLVLQEERNRGSKDLLVKMYLRIVLLQNKFKREFIS